MDIKIYFIDSFVKEAVYTISIPEWGKSLYERSLGDATYALYKLYKEITSENYGKRSRSYYESFAHNFKDLLMTDALFGADEYYFDRNNILKVINLCELIKDSLVMIKVAMNVSINDKYIDTYIDGLIHIGKINPDLKYIILEQVQDMDYAKEAEFIKTMMYMNAI